LVNPNTYIFSKSDSQKHLFKSDAALSLSSESNLFNSLNKLIADIKIALGLSIDLSSTMISRFLLPVLNLIQDRQSFLFKPLLSRLISQVKRGV